VYTPVDIEQFTLVFKPKEETILAEEKIAVEHSSSTSSSNEQTNIPDSNNFDRLEESIIEISNNGNQIETNDESDHDAKIRHLEEIQSDGRSRRLHCDLISMSIIFVLIIMWLPEMLSFK
jgi:hypothetical protein